MDLKKLLDRPKVRWPEWVKRSVVLKTLLEKLRVS
ncbi:hypothetical protein [Bacteriovorax sp. BAL6_X]